MEVESKLSEIQSRLESMNSIELIVFLKSLYNSTYQKGLDHVNSEEYEKAKEQFDLLASYYSVTADMIKKENQFADLRENLDFFRETAVYLQSKAKKMQFEKEFDIAKSLNTLLQEGNFKEAIELCDKAILTAKPSEEHILYNNKGNAHFYLKEFEHAVRSYDKAIEINPQYSEAWFNKGLAFYTMGEFEDAVRSYDKAIEINPQYSEAWFNKGLSFESLSKIREAIKCYEKAIEINPQYSEAWFSKGLVKYTLGQYEDAIRSYDKAIEINPQYSEAWFKKGLALHNIQISRYDEAVACYYKALENNLDSIGIKANLAEALLLSKKYEQCEREATGLLQRTDYKIYGFIIRLLIVISRYFLDRPIEGRNAIRDFIEYYESLSADFEINWMFDGLRYAIHNNGSISEENKETLLMLVNTKKIKDQIEKDKIIEKINGLIDEKDIKKRIKQSFASVKDLVTHDKVKETDIHILNTSTIDKEIDGWYNWEIFIQAEKNVLDRIDFVTYHLHPTFNETEITVTDRKDGFKLKSRGWGEFRVGLDIYLKDGEKIQRYHWLTLEDRGEYEKPANQGVLE